MRPRKIIEVGNKGDPILEVLLDIRNLLAKEYLREQKSNGEKDLGFYPTLDEIEKKDGK